MRQENQKRYDDIQKLSSLLDSSFQGPFGIRFGLDALIGLIPGLGDLITMSMSFYIIYQSARIGCHPLVILRMLLNVFFDNLIDCIPLLGTVFDVIWKANQKNMVLLDGYLKDSKTEIRNSHFLFAGVLVMVLLVVIFSVYTSWFVLSKILEYVGLIT